MRGFMVPVYALIGGYLWLSLGSAAGQGGAVIVNADNSDWHGAVTLASGWNRVTVIKNNGWTHDPGRGAIGAGGNGTVANAPRYPLTNGVASEGALIARVRESNQIYHIIGHTHLCIVGLGVAEFKMNDDRYTDNEGSLKLVSEPVPKCD